MGPKPIISALNQIRFTANTKSSTYYNKRGDRLPRVTEILDRCIHNDSLMYWANSLGFKGIRYRDFMSNAANIGTAAHNAIERFLMNKLDDTSNIPFLGFLSWWNIVTQDLHMPIEIIYIEHQMSCRYYGGTLDALARIGGKVYLIDFKTSNHVTFSYMLQLAAYRYILRKEERIDINGAIVLQLDKTTPGFNEYLLDFSIKSHLEFMDHCEQTFLSLVYAYYNLSKAESDFKKLFPNSK